MSPGQQGMAAQELPFPSPHKDLHLWRGEAEVYAAKTRKMAVLMDCMALADGSDKCQVD